jgi:putative transposase
MPRVRRLTPPGTIQHIITRFRNKEFRIAGPKERAEYLRRLGESLARIDWLLLAYAIMSSHMHLALLAGAGRIDRMMRSLNTGFGLWLNRRQGRTGAVFEGRFHSISIPIERTAELIAYQHNNPVRARVAKLPCDSDWTSHRFYAGREHPPRWLAVETGLALAGFDARPTSRAAFDQFTLARVGDGRDIELSGGEMKRRRVAVRREMGGQVELCSERAVAPGRIESPIHTLAGTPLLPRWTGPLPRLLGDAARQVGVPPSALRSRDRSRRVVRARRLALLVGTRHLGRAQVEVAAHLGLSEAAASQLLANETAVRELELTAAILAEHLRRDGGG